MEYWQLITTCISANLSEMHNYRLRYLLCPQWDLNLDRLLTLCLNIVLLPLTAQSPRPVHHMLNTTEISPLNLSCKESKFSAQTISIILASHALDLSCFVSDER